MKDFKTILFPHSHLPETGLKKVLPLFGPITVFQPWFMGAPTFMPDIEGPAAVTILNPPNHMKPGEGFKALLAEYKTWMTYHKDRSTREFIKANREPGAGGNATWDIRQMLRENGRHQPNREKDEVLRWHLILHLARDVEDELKEADRALRVLKDKKSPLGGLFEEGEAVTDVFKDLTAFESKPPVDENYLASILEAWFALFGVYLKENELLITLNRQVMHFVSDLWKETETKGQNPLDTIVRFEFPDLSHHTLVDLIAMEKTFIEDADIGELKNVMMDLWKDPQNSLFKLDELVKETAPRFPWEDSGGILDITVKHLIPYSGEDYDERLRPLSGKTMILVEDKANSE